MQEQEVNASANLLLLLIAAPVSYFPQFTKFKIGVWCNVSIRVLGTRGDSSTLSSPTKPFSGSDVAGNMRVFQTRLESSNLSFRSRHARVAKWLRRWIANPVLVSSSLTARSRLQERDPHPARQPPHNRS
jgi:hypothetical protein